MQLVKTKFLITGVCGFVAQFFIEYLIDNHQNADILGVDTVENCSLDYSNFQYKQLDMLNKSDLKQILIDYKPDYIVHLASISSVSKSWQMPVESFVNNTNIFLNLLEAVRQLKLNSRILSVGSSEEYGDYPKDKMPLKEDYELKPNNPYAVARVSQEMLSKIYAEHYGLNVVITRSFNHIGPRQRDIFVVPSFVKQLVSISKQAKKGVINVGNVDLTRDFIDIRDVVDAYYKILTKGKVAEIYNVCGGHGIKLRDIIGVVSSLLNIDVEIKVDKARIRPCESEIIIGDNSKLQNELGWMPKFTIEKSLQDMVKYWESELA